MVKLAKGDITIKERRTIFVSTNWIKFFLADFFLAGGIDWASNGSTFFGTFGIVAGIGLIINLVFSITKDWD